jgi:hypothetical protein
MNEMQYWMEGYPNLFILPSGVDTGGMKYWFEGFPVVSIVATTGAPASPFIPKVIFFF